MDFVRSISSKYTELLQFEYYKILWTELTPNAQTLRVGRVVHPYIKKIVCCCDEQLLNNLVFSKLLIIWVKIHLICSIIMRPNSILLTFEAPFLFSYIIHQYLFPFLRPHLHLAHFSHAFFIYLLSSPFFRLLS